MMALLFIGFVLLLAIAAVMLLAWDIMTSVSTLPDDDADEVRRMIDEAQG